MVERRNLREFRLLRRVVSETGRGTRSRRGGRGRKVGLARRRNGKHKLQHLILRCRSHQRRPLRIADLRDGTGTARERLGHASDEVVSLRSGRGGRRSIGRVGTVADGSRGSGGEDVELLLTLCRRGKEEFADGGDRSPVVEFDRENRRRTVEVLLLQPLLPDVRRLRR